MQVSQLLTYLRDKVSGDGVLPFDIFIRHVLYAPGLGYYTRTADRVGRSRQADFYTASSLGPLFSKLVIAACQRLLPGDPAEFTFVEIGAEPGTGVVHNADHPFAAQRTIRSGEPIVLEGKLIVFSNELFDAQPFRRFKVVNGEWRERGVHISTAGLSEVLLPRGGALPALPSSAPEGYELDAPTGSTHLMQMIATQPWQGLFVAFDYGLDWHTLMYERPQGTARTYRQHRMGSDLLADPGETDITCHICWDWLEAVLGVNRFNGITLQRQEAFFMHHAQQVIEAIMAGSAQRGLHRDVQTLKELLHPENMGMKFQVLHAIRS